MLRCNYCVRRMRRSKCR
eukprot:jgi/Chlat1/7333/Chrsp59S06957